MPHGILLGALFCFIPNRSKNQMFPGTASRAIPIFKLNVSGVMQNGKLQWVLAWGFVLAMSWGNGELWGQTTIAKQGFETSGETWSISSGSGNISTVTGSGDTPSSQRVLSGGRSWQVNNGNITLELGNVNVSSYSTIKIVIRLSSISGLLYKMEWGQHKGRCQLEWFWTFHANPGRIISGNNQCTDGDIRNF